MPHEIDLTRLSEPELVALNRRIMARLKSLRDIRCREELLRFDIGDLVSFYDRGGRQIFGVLTKFNHKTAVVVAEDGVKWRVSPVFLRRMKDLGPGAKVIPFAQPEDRL